MNNYHSVMWILGIAVYVALTITVIASLPIIFDHLDAEHNYYQTCDNK